MNKEQITSPCISSCKTDPRTGFCYGGGRTDAEKKTWKEEKTTVIWKKEKLPNLILTEKFLWMNVLKKIHQNLVQIN